MRDAIARALLWVLSVLPWTRRTNPGRHSAVFLAEHEPTPEPRENPWSNPWTGPTKDEACALFQQQAEMTLELSLPQERRRAAALATLGIDYPYTYAGAPFPASAFARTKVTV
jgi:hypothetical protein